MATTGDITASLYGGYYNSYWNWNGTAYQGEYSNYGHRMGSIRTNLGTTVKGTDISKIVFTMTFSGSGVGDWYEKEIKFYKATSQTLDTSGTPTIGEFLGSFTTGAYNNTVTITFNSSTNSSLFANLKSYLEAGNTHIMMYNGDTDRYSTDYTYDYLSMTNCIINVTYALKYTLTVSAGTGISAVTGGGSYTAGTEVALTATLSTGYNFSKWTSSDTSLLANSTTQNPTITMPAGAVTYTASGTLKTYAISYKKGANGSGTEVSDTKTHGTDITLKGATFTRTGYTQTGWSTTDGGSQTHALSATYSTNAALTLYPVWTARTYTVTYNANGGSGTMSASTATYNQGFKTTTNAFTRVGYTFAGWNESADGTGVAWGISSSDSGTAESGNSWVWTYTKNITLYAVWTVNSYTFTLGTATGVSTAGSTATGSYAYGSTITLKATANSGYTWSQWTSNNTSLQNSLTTANTSFTMPAGNITMTPTVVANGYIISFNGNGATGGSMDNMSCSYGTTYTLTANGFTRPGYEFLGWSQSNTATTATYSDQQSVSNLATSGTVVLYAIWKAKSQTFIWEKKSDGTYGWIRVLKYVYGGTAIGTEYQLTVNRSSSTPSTYTYSVYNPDSANKLINETSVSSGCVIYDNLTTLIQINRESGYTTTCKITSGTANLTVYDYTTSYKIYALTNPSSDVVVTYTVDTTSYEL